MNAVIKICPDPQCEAVYHNTPKNKTKCLDCGGNIIMINEKTYWKKFSQNFFQYDYQSGCYHRPNNNVIQTIISFL